MPFTLTMPKLSPTMVEGTIAKWHKKVGEFAESGDLLFEVATDKATVEYNALDSGWIKKILKTEGQKAQVNEPLAILTEDEKESIVGYEPEGIAPPSKEPARKEAPRPAAKEEQPKAPIPQKLAPKPLNIAQPVPKLESRLESKPESRYDRTLASPLAKNIARHQGLDISQIQGTGPHGRVMSRDLEAFASRQEEPTQPQQTQQKQAQQKEPVSKAKDIPSQATFPLEAEELPLSPMRKVIADRLQYAKSTIPHFYLRQEIEVTALVAMREEVKKFELNFTINDFIIKAVALALRKHPGVNSTFNPEKATITRIPTVDISVAVTISGGLITPIIANADKKPLAAISQEIKALAQKAKEGKLKPEEYQGGTFTISNLGMFGITDFQAIINPPQTAILAVGTIQEKPVIKNSTIVPGKVLSITLSCDHRAVDGAEAAHFIKTLRELLENPTLFLTQ